MGRVIENNTITGLAVDERTAGNAIHAWKAKNLEIAYNMATGHRDGIYFEFVNNSKIHHNQSFSNLRYGLHFMFSNDDQYLCNEFRENEAGVAVMFSKAQRPTWPATRAWRKRTTQAGEEKVYEWREKGEMQIPKFDSG